MLTEWEKNEEQRKANIVLYGVNESDATVAVRVALEATRKLASEGMLNQCSQTAQEWHAHHQLQVDEADRVVAEREARDRLRQKTIAKLSPQELEALGVKVSALY